MLLGKMCTTTNTLTFSENSSLFYVQMSSEKPDAIVMEICIFIINARPYAVCFGWPHLSSMKSVKMRVVVAGISSLPVECILTQRICWNVIPLHLTS